MDKIQFIKSHLEKEKKLLLKTIEKAKETRDSAQNPMESHSDTTKAQAEKLMFALEEKLQDLEKIFPILDSSKVTNSDSITTWSYVEMKLGTQKMKLILVPVGIGGREINGVKLISVDSPLGKFLIEKESKEKSVFLGKDIEVTKAD